MLQWLRQESVQSHEDYAPHTVTGHPFRTVVLPVGTAFVHILRPYAMNQQTISRISGTKTYPGQ